MAATDARPVPRKGVPFRYYFTAFDVDGVRVTDWEDPTAFVCKDGLGFGPTANAPVEIGTTGFGYLDLTASEMDADAVIVTIKVGDFAKDVAFYPESLGDYRVLNVINSVAGDPTPDGDGLFWIQLLSPYITIDDRTYNTGDVVAVTAAKRTELVRQGHAVDTIAPE